LNKKIQSSEDEKKEKRMYLINDALLKAKLSVCITIHLHRALEQRCILSFAKAMSLTG